MEGEGEGEGEAGREGGREGGREMREVGSERDINRHCMALFFKHLWREGGREGGR